MDKTRRNTAGAAPGRTMSATAIGLGVMGIGLLILVTAAVAFIIANQPQPPTPTPDVQATSGAITAATVEAASTMTAEAQATTGAREVATAQAAALATAEALSTARAFEAATAAAQAEATARAQAAARAAATATAEAAPTATALAQATAIASAPILFQDSFDSNANGWELGESSGDYADNVTQIVDGKYVMSMTSRQSVLWWKRIPDLLAQDFFLSVEVTVVETSAAPGDANVSLTFREEEDGNRYRVRFDNNGSYKVYLWQDEWKTLQDWETHETIRLEEGVTNVFAILAQGAQFTVYANGQALATVYESTLSQPGEISLALGLAEADQDLTVAFDNLVVKEVPAGKTVAEIQATATARAVAEATAEAVSAATAVARATAIAGAAILFQDEFDSNGNGWDLDESSDEYTDSVTQISAGKYIRFMTSKQNVLWWESIPGLSLQDFFLSVEATIVETSAARGEADVSLTFREDDDGNLYRVMFSNDGSYKVYLRRDGEWETIQDWKFNEAIQLEEGVTNTFAILVWGREFTVYANGQELSTVTDATLSQAGEIGLAIGLLEADQTLTVEFDNLVVKEIP